jgi:hypothetical protein
MHLGPGYRWRTSSALLGAGLLACLSGCKSAARAADATAQAVNAGYAEARAVGKGLISILPYTTPAPKGPEEKKLAMEKAVGRDQMLERKKELEKLKKRLATEIKPKDASFVELRKKMVNPDLVRSREVMRGKEAPNEGSVRSLAEIPFDHGKRRVVFPQPLLENLLPPIELLPAVVEGDSP